MTSKFNTPSLPIDPDSIKGFLAKNEAHALYHYAQSISHIGPCLEIGSYCGKSTLYLGHACQQKGNTLFAIDHHQGSEEHQLGEEYHDPELFDSTRHCVDTFSVFRSTLQNADLDDTVVPIVSSSTVVARHWSTPLGMVFIDGGHSFDAALNDYCCWSRHIRPGGILAIHDLFPDPDQGGQAPITIYNQALASGQFIALDTVETLGLLVRR
jgi:MMP 1-O-methyltransferase